jgi:hypothetical protein
MATVPLSHPAEGARAGIATRSRGAPRSGALLAIALLALILYAAFAHGAGGLASGARIQVVLAVLAAGAGAGAVWTGSLRFAAPRVALAGIGLLGAFAIWNGVTLLWSVAPDQTWTELNRVLDYCVVLCLAVLVGASERRALELVAGGFAAVALAVTAYALGQKLFPGLHVAGLFDLNQTGPLPRLQEPLGYWNALALLIALAVPAAIAAAADRARGRRLRLGALLAAQLMVVTIGFTYSRGGLIALALGCAATVAASGARLRMLMWLGVVVLAAIPGLVFGLSDHALTAANVPLGSREGAGAILLAFLVVPTLVMLAGASRLQQRETASAIGPERVRRIGRALGIAVVGVLLAALIAVALSPRGLTGTASHAWNSFTATRATSNDDPTRLLSADSENRWVWWKEAAGAFSDRPLGGWGAGSFGVVHLLYRRDTLSVTQPHSVPLQFLAETGVVGAVLALAGLGLLLAAGVRFVRRLPAGSPRLVAAALLGGAVAYAIHELYDWDWDIPAVTLPALLFLGVLAGAGAGGRTGAGGRAGAGPEEDPGGRLTTPGRGARALALGVLALGLTVLAVSGTLPSIAAGDADSAVVSASGPPSALPGARAQAQLASSLDPLSSAGLRLEATIAQREGDPAGAHADLLAAVSRDPGDGGAWSQLAFLELSRGDYAQAARAATRVLALDPHRAGALASARTISQVANLSLTPPKGSATARPLGG